MSNSDSTLVFAQDEKLDMSSSLSIDSSKFLEQESHSETLDEIDNLEGEPREDTKPAKVTIVDRIRAFHRNLQLKGLKFKLRKTHEHKLNLLASAQRNTHSTPNMSGTETPVSFVATEPTTPVLRNRLVDATNRLAELHELRRKSRSIWASEEQKKSAHNINAQYAFLQIDINKLRKEIISRELKSAAYQSDSSDTVVQAH
jgi:hypothetical protein